MKATAVGNALEASPPPFGAPGGPRSQKRARALFLGPGPLRGPGRARDGFRGIPEGRGFHICKFQADPGPVRGLATPFVPDSPFFTNFHTPQLSVARLELLVDRLELC